MNSLNEITLNSIPMFVLLLIGYVADVPVWLKIAGIVGALLFGIINAYIAISKEIRERKKEKKQF